MATAREKALANAIERLSGRDLSRFIDAISYRYTGSGSVAYNLTTHDRYYLMREIINYAKDKGATEEETT